VDRRFRDGLTRAFIATSATEGIPMQHEHSAPCSHCSALPAEAASAPGIGRRTFLAQSAMMAAIAALAACSVGSDMTAPSLSGQTTINLSDQPSLANVGGVALVTISSSPFAIVRTGASTFVTLSRVCPHQGSTVNLNGNGFLCPNHGAAFSITGSWMGGQPTNNMQSYATSYDATAGTITIG
jgi:nitrite reductase/ring-hydroxylating ferredoxin subunit